MMFCATTGTLTVLNMLKTIQYLMYSLAYGLLTINVALLIILAVTFTIYSYKSAKMLADISDIRKYVEQYADFSGPMPSNEKIDSNVLKSLQKSKYFAKSELDIYQLVIDFKDRLFTLRDKLTQHQITAWCMGLLFSGFLLYLRYSNDQITKATALTTTFESFAFLVTFWAISVITILHDLKLTNKYDEIRNTSILIKQLEDTMIEKQYGTFNKYENAIDEICNSSNDESDDIEKIMRSHISKSLLESIGISKRITNYTLIHKLKLSQALLKANRLVYNRATTAFVNFAPDEMSSVKYVALNQFGKIRTNAKFQDKFVRVIRELTDDTLINLLMSNQNNNASLEEQVLIKQLYDDIDSINKYLATTLVAMMEVLPQDKDKIDTILISNGETKSMSKEALIKYYTKSV